MEKDFDLAGRVIGMAMEVHRSLGPGFVESVYENALGIELGASNLRCEFQKALKVNYKEQCVGDFFADIVVENLLIVELKSVQSILQIHEVQLVNYLTATGIEEGVLINFGAASLQFKKKFRKQLQHSQPHSFNF
jgi:GxxExxY protein